MDSFTVGRSSRTPFKHWLLNAELGRLVGIFASRSSWKVPALANPFLVVDLCAGDGRHGEHNDSSPSIILKHLGKAATKDVDVSAVFIERAPVTFESLCKNVPREEWATFLNLDARDWKPPPFKPRQAVFIHSDPNHIGDWPITLDLIGSLSKTTTMLATLGCNVGGLKRLPIEERARWFDHVKECLSVMPHWHDALLICLQGDSSQWAYLMRLPEKWSATTARNIKCTGSRYTSYALEISSYRYDRTAFDQMQDRLFLQKKELQCKQTYMK